jgi:hypothetical protein
MPSRMSSVGGVFVPKVSISTSTSHLGRPHMRLIARSRAATRLTPIISKLPFHVWGISRCPHSKEDQCWTSRYNPGIQRMALLRSILC